MDIGLKEGGDGGDSTIFGWGGDGGGKVGWVVFLLFLLLERLLGEGTLLIIYIKGKGY